MSTWCTAELFELNQTSWLCYFHHYAKETKKIRGNLFVTNAPRIFLCSISCILCIIAVGIYRSSVDSGAQVLSFWWPCGWYIVGPWGRFAIVWFAICYWSTSDSPSALTFYDNNTFWIVYINLRWTLEIVWMCLYYIAGCVIFVVDWIVFSAKSCQVWCLPASVCRVRIASPLPARVEVDGFLSAQSTNRQRSASHDK